MVLRSQHQLPGTPAAVLPGTAPVFTTVATDTATDGDAADGDEGSDGAAVDDASGSITEIQEVHVDSLVDPLPSTHLEIVTELPTTPGDLFVEFQAEMSSPEGDKNAKIIKKSQLSAFKRLNRVIVPAAWIQDCPSPSELFDKMAELYDAQTKLVVSYADVGALLNRIGNIELGFCLVTIRDPRQLDFRCLTAPNLVGSNRAGCLVRMPPMKSLCRDDILTRMIEVF